MVNLGLYYNSTNINKQRRRLFLFSFFFWSIKIKGMFVFLWQYVIHLMVSWGSGIMSCICTLYYKTKAYIEHALSRSTYSIWSYSLGMWTTKTNSATSSHGSSERSIQLQQIVGDYRARPRRCHTDVYYAWTEPLKVPYSWQKAVPPGCMWKAFT